LPSGGPQDKKEKNGGRESMNKQIRVGYHTITWGIEMFHTAIRDIGGLGFKGVETFGVVADQYHDTLDDFKLLLQEHGLQLVTLYGGGTLSTHEAFTKDLQWNLRLANFLRENGAEILVLGGGVREDTTPTEETIKQMADNLNTIGERLLAMGIKAAYHPHLGTVIETRKEIGLLMDHTDPRYVFLCPDTAHLYKGGVNAVEVINTYKDRIIHVHFKDVNPEATLPVHIDAEDQLPIFVELGKGPIDFPGILKTLRDSNYSGWIVIELDQSLTDPRQSAYENKKYIQEVLRLSV
jgi:inosose dehydratase